MTHHSTTRISDNNVAEAEIIHANIIVKSSAYESYITRIYTYHASHIVLTYLIWYKTLYQQHLLQSALFPSLYISMGSPQKAITTLNNEQPNCNREQNVIALGKTYFADGVRINSIFICNPHRIRIRKIHKRSIRTALHPQNPQKINPHLHPRGCGLSTSAHRYRDPNVALQSSSRVWTPQAFSSCPTFKEELVRGDCANDPSQPD